MEQIKAVPVLFGETDILKTLQLLPGVQNGTEGMNGVYVRGGGPDENLFLLDGVSVYNVNHLGGFFSAFNSSAVKNVTLYKGSFPARLRRPKRRGRSRFPAFWRAFCTATPFALRPSAPCAARGCCCSADAPRACANGRSSARACLPRFWKACAA